MYSCFPILGIRSYHVGTPFIERSLAGYPRSSNCSCKSPLKGCLEVVHYPTRGCLEAFRSHRSFKSGDSVTILCGTKNEVVWSFLIFLKYFNMEFSKRRLIGDFILIFFAKWMICIFKFLEVFQLKFYLLL